MVRHLVLRRTFIPGDERFQNPGVLDVSRRLPAAGLGQLIDTDVAHGPIRVGCGPWDSQPIVTSRYSNCMQCHSRRQRLAMRRPGGLAVLGR
jgi:hypothetical protein